jgi:hypothetical protein
MTRSFAGIAVCLTLVLLAAGCGGSSDSSALTKQQFVQQANKICLEGSAKRGQIVNEATAKLSGKKVTRAQQESLVEEVIEPYEEQTARLDELEAPAGDEEKVEAIVAAMEAASERVKASPETALTGDLPFKKANKLAEGYGLDKCSV